MSRAGLIGLDRSASDRPRVLLDRVVIHGLEPARTPARVRISLDPATPADLLRPGMRLLGQARLSPPAAPAEPGGFDFRRLAWFERLGAVGYARTPMRGDRGLRRPGLRQLAFRLRMAASAHIQARVPGQDGAFAAAILTGDRSGDRPLGGGGAAELEPLPHRLDLRAAHDAARGGGLRDHPLRAGAGAAAGADLAAEEDRGRAALAAGGGYLLISGCEVPAQRSYVMTATVLVAVLLDRPALTMRSVALAALIVLAMAPESLMQPGSRCPSRRRSR